MMGMGVWSDGGRVLVVGVVLLGLTIKSLACNSLVGVVLEGVVYWWVF